MSITQKWLAEQMAEEDFQVWFNQVVLDYLATDNQLRWGKWLLDVKRLSNCIYKAEELVATDCSVFYAGGVDILGDISVGNHLLVGKGIRAGGSIKVKGDIYARGNVQSVGEIEAGENIYVKYNLSSESGIKERNKKWRRHLCKAKNKSSMGYRSSRRYRCRRGR